MDLFSLTVDKLKYIANKENINILNSDGKIKKRIDIIFTIYNNISNKKELKKEDIYNYEYNQIKKYFDMNVSEINELLKNSNIYDNSYKKYKKYELIVVYLKYIDDKSSPKKSSKKEIDKLPKKSPKKETDKSLKKSSKKEIVKSPKKSPKKETGKSPKKSSKESSDDEISEEYPKTANSSDSDSQEDILEELDYKSDESISSSKGKIVKSLNKNSSDDAYNENTDIDTDNDIDTEIEIDSDSSSNISGVDSKASSNIKEMSHYKSDTDINELLEKVNKDNIHLSSLDKIQKKVFESLGLLN